MMDAIFGHDNGLSPRGRGNPRHGRRARRHWRSIPAWAGEPDSLAWLHCSFEVYPRVGGGTASDMRPCPCSVGLSPRGRGNPVRGVVVHLLRGSIPAWAGEPRDGAAVCPRWAVYPRVGGGTWTSISTIWWACGLSPRGRGNPRRASSLRESWRSIPAWAGEPPIPSGSARIYAVYPRVGGGTRRGADHMQAARGLSPRGRGNQRATSFANSRNGSIPAWAGEPRKWLARKSRPGVYPRVGGGTLASIHARMSAAGLSPRGRGNLCRP